MARCLRRKRLYQDYLVAVDTTLCALAQQSDWPARPGALEPGKVRDLVGALEDILDTYVVYGVRMDLDRLRARGVFRSDVKRPPALDDVFAPSDGDERRRTDKKTLTAKDAYARYFDWYIGADVVWKGQKKSGVKAFYERYPLLEHAVRTAAKHYGDNIGLACDRVKKHWADIEKAFFPDAQLVHLKTITTTGNDFHKGGKQVLILTFEISDRKSHEVREGKVVYKPSGVEIDCRIVGNSKVVKAVKPDGYEQDESLTEILNASNPVKTYPSFTTKPLPTYVILPYERQSVPNAYGFIEFLTHEPDLSIRATEKSGVSRAVADAILAAQSGPDVLAKSDWIITDLKDGQVFFYQLGVLMAMALAVSLCDLHVQNAIVHARQPHLIDLEEALKRPMTTIHETMLDEVATQPWDPGGRELKITNDDASGFSAMWLSPPHVKSATCMLYRYDAAKPRAERVSRVSVVADDARSAPLETPLRSAIVRGVSDAVDALASDEGNRKVKAWVSGLTQTIARFVTLATSDYLGASRALYATCGTNACPGDNATADAAAYRDFKDAAGDAFFVAAARARRSDWDTSAKSSDQTKKDLAAWNPRFAVEHPDHAWKDYLNGDVPAFYHRLGSRDLLNSRGDVVDVDAVNQWQVKNLGVAALSPAFGREYFPKTPTDVVTGQLGDLKAACSTPAGKRDYITKIAAGIGWLGARSLDNLLPKLNAERVKFPFADGDMRSLGDLVSDFVELPPLPQYDGKEEPALAQIHFPDREVALIQPKAAHSGKFAYAEELKAIPFPRVVAYGFRGDSRKPLQFKVEAAKAMQGFLPNYTRPTHIEKVEEWRKNPEVIADPTKSNMAWIGPDGKKRNIADVEKGAFDLRFYIANEFMGGYISLTRDAMVARSFACGKGGTPRPNPGAWVYCCLAEGAFSVPRAGTHAWATKNEAELAMPGMLDWDDVVGFRQVTEDGRFTGPVYLRRSLQKAEREAFTELYRVLSGKKQGVSA